MPQLGKANSQVSAVSSAAKSKNSAKKRNRRKAGKGRTSSMTSMERRVDAPVSKGNVMAIGKPRVSQLSNGDARIVHREYLGEVVGSAAFSSTQFPIQPGSSTTFPWLNQIARRYEKYRFNRLRFCYETDCSTATAGTVMLVPDYDASDAAPVSKIQALTYEDAARGQAWTAFCFEAAQENLRALPQYYVSTGVAPAATDVKTYNVGNMFLCVSGFSMTPTVGELWVEYDVTLITPDSAIAADSEQIQSGGTVSQSAPLGSAPVLAGTMNVVVTGAGTTITFNQAFSGLVLWDATGTVLSGLAITSTGISKALYSTVINSAATVGIASLVVNAVPGDVLTFTPTATTITNSNVVFAAGGYGPL